MKNHWMLLPLAASVLSVATANDASQVIDNSGGGFVSSEKLVSSDGSCWVQQATGAGEAYYYKHGCKKHANPSGNGGGRYRFRRALSERQMAETEFSPADKTKLYQGTDNFFNVSSTTEVDCMMFHHKENSTSFTVCDGVMADDSYSPPIYFVRNGFLAIGNWTWKVNYTDGTESDSRKFTMGYAQDDPEVDSTMLTMDAEAQEEVITRAGNAVADAVWPYAGQIQTATGRLYYQVNNGARNLACSGTVIRDHKSGRSLVVTAAHCVYDDVYGQFGENVIFIPDRHSNLGLNLTDDERGNIHRSCEEDPCGCWTMSAGFVLEEWKNHVWPENLPWDWGVWVVNDKGAHAGGSKTNGNCGSDALDQAVPEIEFELGVPLDTVELWGMGYSLEHNPDFHYCEDYGRKETLEGFPHVVTWWIPACQLNPGSSGGPWVVDMNKKTGKATLVTVNSWSYFEGSSGNGGPIIDSSVARCLVNAARDADFEAIEAEDPGKQGVFVDCSDRPCVRPGQDSSTSTRKLATLSNMDGKVVHSEEEMHRKLGQRILCEKDDDKDDGN